MEQDPAVVFPILEYRLAMDAKAIAKDDVTKMQPAHASIWKEMLLAIKE